MSIELTDEQKKHKGSIMWLLNGPIMSGRSFLLAHCYIETAIHQPHRSIYINELNGTKESNHYLMRRVHYIISSMSNDVAKLFVFNLNSITFKP